MAEFVVTTDLALVRNLEIAANFDEMKAAVEQMMAPYQKMIVTEDGVKDAKADRAKINSVAKRIDEVRKAVKAEVTAPLADFEKKCNEIKAIAVTAGENLDRQIKSYEMGAAEARVEALRGFYLEKSTEDEREFISFERMAELNPKWKNVTYGEKNAQNDIMRTLANVKGGIAALRGYPDVYRAALLDRFKKTLDLREVAALYDDIQKRERWEAAREAERQFREEQLAERQKQTAPEPPKVAETPKAPEQPQGEVRVMDFRVWATRDQLACLADYLKSNGIKYGRVPTNKEENA